MHTCCAWKEGPWRWYYFYRQLNELDDFSILNYNGSTWTDHRDVLIYRFMTLGLDFTAAALSTFGACIIFNFGTSIDIR